MLTQLERAVPGYMPGLCSPVGSPGRLALVADLRAALPDVLDALGVA